MTITENKIDISNIGYIPSYFISRYNYEAEIRTDGIQYQKYKPPPQYRINPKRKLVTQYIQHETEYFHPKSD